MNAIGERLRQQFPQYVRQIHEALGELSVMIHREGVVPVCRFLHDDPEMDFDHITDICSVDYPEDDERFEVIYHFFSIRNRRRVRVKTRVPEEDCRVDSVTGIWQGANFLEREVYDMMGIDFRGHPDLRRILLTDDFEGFPLRKDFPTEGKGWRNTFEFIPMIMED